MKSGIRYRLFLAFLAATGLIVICMFLIMQWSIDRGFLRYINTLEQQRIDQVAEVLEQLYLENGGWDFLLQGRADWHGILARARAGENDSGSMDASRRRPEREGDAAGRSRGSRYARYFEKRVLLLDAGRDTLIGPEKIPDGQEFRRLASEGRIIGYFGLLPRKHLSDIHQLRFVKQQKLALALVGGVLILVSAGVAYPLSNRLVRPIRSMAAASNRLAAGEYAVRVPVESTDELGRLARDFNLLAATLEKNESARRQWFADISHELRTPLAILRGEIEAIEDGIRQPTPEALRSLHSEVMHLGKLVDDLYQLSLSDFGALTYRKQNLDPVVLLREAVETFRGEFMRKNLTVDLSLPAEGDLTLFGDPERLHRLFINLLDNSLKYTDAGGRMDIRMTGREGELVVDFMDSAPGVSDSERERIFDRFFRVEESRNRASGGAGLGLSICRNIVEAHQGSLVAKPSPLGGLWIRLCFPREKN